MVIAGPPNAGKSSILNALAKRDVAIVSEEAGTTRDVIEVHLDIGDVPVILALEAQILQAHRQCQELTERIPPQVVFLHELLDVLGRRTARTGLVQSTTGHQRHDREHLGAGTEFEDREQVGEVVTQDVAGRGDGVHAANDPFERVPHRSHLRHVRDVQALGVVILEVGLHLLDQFVLVRTVRVEPEHHRRTRIARPVDRELDPVPDRGVLDHAHPEDVALFDVLRQQYLTGGDVDDVGHTVGLDLESLVVRTVLLGLLRHQADVGHGAHRSGIERAVGFTEVHDLLIDARERRLRVDRLGVLRAPVGAVHLAAGPDHRRHRRVDDHIGGGVEVGDTARRVDHRQFRPVLVALVQIIDDLFTFGRRQRLDLRIQVRQTVVDVDAEFVEQLAVFGEGVLVEGAHGVTEDDRV